jgi:hypothetical protein
MHHALGVVLLAVADLVDDGAPLLAVTVLDHDGRPGDGLLAVAPCVDVAAPLPRYRRASSVLAGLRLMDFSMFSARANVLRISICSKSP